MACVKSEQQNDPFQNFKNKQNKWPMGRQSEERHTKYSMDEWTHTWEVFMEKNRRYFKGKSRQLQKVLLWEKKRIKEDLSWIMVQYDMKHFNIAYFPCNYIIVT